MSKEQVRRHSYCKQFKVAVTTHIPPSDPTHLPGREGMVSPKTYGRRSQLCDPHIDDAQCSCGRNISIPTTMATKVGGTRRCPSNADGNGCSRREDYSDQGCSSPYLQRQNAVHSSHVSRTLSDNRCVRHSCRQSSPRSAHHDGALTSSAACAAAGSFAPLRACLRLPGAGFSAQHVETPQHVGLSGGLEMESPIHN